MSYLDDFENGSTIEASTVAKVWGSLVVALLLLNLLILAGSELAKLMVGFVFSLFTVALYAAFDRSFLALGLVWCIGTLVAIWLTLSASNAQREGAMIGWGSVGILAIGLPPTAIHSFEIWGEFA